MLRMKFIKPIMLLLYLVGLAGCKEDTFADWLELSEGIKISYSIEGITDENGRSVSRATTDTEMPEITDVNFVFFQEDGRYEKTVTSTVSDGIISLPTGDIANDKSYKVLIVGNGNSFTPEDYANFGAYIDALNLSYTALQEQLYLTGNPTATTYPLIGDWCDGIGKSASFIMSDGKVNGTVKFKRSVCRIDFQLGPDFTGFTVEAIKLCNSRLGTHPFVDGNALDLYANYTYSTPYNTNWVNLSGAQTSQVQHFYIFPNEVTRPNVGDDVTSCILIKGKKAGSDAVKYYRFNLCNKNYTQKLEANHRYLAQIEKLESDGYDSEMLAWKSAELITVTPMSYAFNKQGNFDINGFDPTPCNTPGFAGSYPNLPINTPLVFQVSLSAAASSFDISTDFDQNVDAYLSTSPSIRHIPQNGSLRNSSTIQTLTGLVSGSYLYLQVYRTGPGDKDIVGSVKIVAKSGTTVIGNPKEFKVRIYTPCDIGNVIIDREKFKDYISTTDYNNMKCAMVLDRNYMVPRYDAANNFIPALSYMGRYQNQDFNSGNYIVGKIVNGSDATLTTENHSSRKMFVGTIPECFGNDHITPPSGWMNQKRYGYGDTWMANATDLNRWKKTLPAGKYYNKSHPNEFICKYNRNCLSQNMIVSKMRVFIISDYKMNNRFVGCYIPVADTKFNYFNPRDKGGLCIEPDNNSWEGHEYQIHNGTFAWGSGSWYNAFLMFGKEAVQLNPQAELLINMWLYSITGYGEWTHWICPSRPWRPISNTEWSANSEYTNRLVPVK